MATKRQVHCFNLLRQTRILSRAGISSAAVQMKERDWDTAAGVARAFSIGRAESSALFQLLTDVPDAIRAKLESCVKTRGMTKFLNHDVIGKGTFSVGFSSAGGAMEGWTDALTNRKDNLDLVSLYLQRIVSDHDSTPEPLRKALSFKEATRLHQATGCFLFMLDALQKIAPASRFGDMKTSLENQFFMKFMDGDLVHCLEERVPLSADLTMVSAFRLGAMMTQSVVRAGCDWGYC
ncbi:Uncharacterized protein SCF082_LOCUS24473 [Durusdinium trenchii]|uniref:Uncharacterized protein n=1 Tax=Durusdinium trenchii TaxID=1381693 RepID=A0ABP0LVK6_9DINO